MTETFLKLAKNIAIDSVRLGAASVIAKQISNRVNSWFPKSSSGEIPLEQAPRASDHDFKD